jgi:hypothetical protein
VLRAELAQLELQRAAIESVDTWVEEKSQSSFFHPFGLHRAGLSNGAPHCKRESTPAAIRAAREIGANAVPVYVDGKSDHLGQIPSLCSIRTIRVVVDVDAWGEHVESLAEERAP